MIDSEINYHPPSRTSSMFSHSYTSDDMITIAPASSPPPPSSLASSPAAPPMHFVHSPVVSDAASTHSSCSYTSSRLAHPRTAVGSCADLSAGKCERLWVCMLELQHRYGCYKSARMRAAVCLWEQGLEPDFMPSPGALDLLNDGIDELPEEGWRLLSKYVTVEGHHPQERGSKKPSRIWRYLSRHGRTW